VDVDGDGVCDDDDDCVGTYDDCDVCNGDNECHTCSSGVVGDFNGDGIVSATDVQYINNVILYGAAYADGCELYNYDLNCNEALSVNDLILLNNAILNETVISSCLDCSGSLYGDAELDCTGECGGSLVEDECGECGGGGSDDLGCGCFEAGPSGCDNSCGSTLENDECGVCGGDNSSCDEGCGPYQPSPSGCDNTCGSTLENDCAGECGGAVEEEQWYADLDGDNLGSGVSLLACEYEIDENIIPEYNACFDGIINLLMEAPEGSPPGVDCSTVDLCNETLENFFATNTESLGVIGTCIWLCDGGNDLGEGCIGVNYVNNNDDSEPSCTTNDTDECGICGGSGPVDNYDCDSNCVAELDCNGDCGGSAIEDECGVCGGDGSDDVGCGCFEDGPSGCDNTCGSTLEEDECGVCGGDGSDDVGCGCFAMLSCVDCAGNPNGNAVEDECGVCEGDNICEDLGLGCDAGYITDCADDDCCPSTWIGDGFEDCADQAYGCDLTCYDNDGGDCDPAGGTTGAGVEEGDTGEWEYLGERANKPYNNGSDRQDCFVIGPDAGCDGVCGSDLVDDDCGICGGSGPVDNYDCEGNCVAELDCNGDCDGPAIEDDCGVCNGDSFPCLGINLSFSNVNTTDGTMDIYMVNELELGGFQIGLSGLNITSASGGSATDAGFMLSGSGSVVLGFSLTGTTVPVGEGVLVSIAFDSPSPEICLAEAATVIVDAAGATITTTLGDCYSGIMLGDINGDGLVNVIDVVSVVNFILTFGSSPPLTADFNSDGLVNVIDVVGMVDLILNPQ